MREMRLLERVGYLEKHPENRGIPNPALLIRSILHHLQRVLNTKQGSVEIAQDYGLPDFTMLRNSYPTDSIKELERSIKEVIQKYEPRLKGVKVSAETRGDDVLSLSFKIDANLALDRAGMNVTFETVLSADGKITVRD